MDKRSLIRHIQGKATAEESEEILKWVDSSPDNERYYISLLNTLSCEHLLTRSGTIKIEDKEKQSRLHRIISKRKPSRFTRTFFYKTAAIAAGIALLVSIGLNLYQFQRKAPVSGPVPQLAESIPSIHHTYYTNSGVKGKIMLPDSSIVWLNSCSRITFPEKFSTSSREVEFEGEGYFEVTKDPQWPMVVTTPKGMQIRVLGTKFSIRSYKEDKAEQATLFSGKIIVSHHSDTMAGKAGALATVMNPGETISFGKNLEQASRSFNVDTVKNIAWKRGQLLFEQTPLAEVCQILERWHGVDISVDDPMLYDYLFTGEFESESIVQILELMRFTMPLSYTIKGNKVLLTKRD